MGKRLHPASSYGTVKSVAFTKTVMTGKTPRVSVVMKRVGRLRSSHNHCRQHWFSSCLASGPELQSISHKNALLLTSRTGKTGHDSSRQHFFRDSVSTCDWLNAFASDGSIEHLQNCVADLAWLILGHRPPIGRPKFIGGSDHSTMEHSCWKDSDIGAEPLAVGE